MGRNLKIPRHEALRSAMKLFWARGFHASTLDDIQKAVGLQRGSLYAHFKSKDDLFLEALDLYQIEVVKKRRQMVLDAGDVRTGVELFFTELIEHSVKNRKHAGCLNTNTAAELSLTDPRIAKRAKSGFKSWEDFWTEVLSQGQARGEIGKTQEARALARVLIALTQGLNIVSKVNPNRAELTSTVQTALAVLN